MYASLVKLGLMKSESMALFSKLVSVETNSFESIFVISSVPFKKAVQALLPNWAISNASFFQDLQILS